MTTRRQILANLLMLAMLTACAGGGATQGRVAFQRDNQDYAIDMVRGLDRPVAAGDVVVFKQIAPLEWNQVRDAAVIERVLDDFNANPEQWRELPSYRRDRLWRPPPEPPL